MLRWLALAMTLLALFGPLGVLLHASALPPGETLRLIWTELGSRLPSFALSADALQFYVMAGAVALALYVQARYRPTLTLTADRIEIDSGVRFLGRGVPSDWQAPLSSIQRAIVHRARSQVDPWLAVELRLTVDGKSRRLQPATWFLPGEAPRARVRASRLALRRLPVELAEIESLPLIRSLRERGVPIELTPATLQARAPDDLARYPMVMAVLGTTVALGTYALVDTVVIDEYYIAGPTGLPLAALALAGASLALLAFKRQTAAPIPWLIRFCVAALFGLVLALAAPPAIKR